MLDPHTAVALSFLPGRARLEVVERLRRTGRVAADAATSTADLPLGDLLARLFPDAADAPGWSAGLVRRARDAIRRAEGSGLSVVPWGSESYPTLLDEIAHPPVALWLRGAQDVLRAQPMVAIVGSRAGSTASRHVAREMAADLAAAGVVVVSGMARGVDGAAHAGALETGRTIAVMGCGADMAYPPEHRDLAERVASTGAVLSELPPGAAPHRFHFPLRNRLISGLCRGVVVVEASERSGSLLTAGWALDQGREVLVVPGSVVDGHNRGGHALVRDGARLVESAAQVLTDLGLGPAASETTAGNPASPAPVVEVMSPGAAVTLDDLQARTGWPADRLLACLLEAELGGRVRRADGGRFVRIGRK